MYKICPWLYIVWCRSVSVFCTVFTAAIVAKHVSVWVSWFVIRGIGFVYLQWRIQEGVTVVLCLWEREKNLQVCNFCLWLQIYWYTCGYSLQLQILLSQTLSCFAPKSEPILPIRRIRRLHRAPETPGGPLALKDVLILLILNLASCCENMNDHFF